MTLKSYAGRRRGETEYPDNGAKPSGYDAPVYPTDKKDDFLLLEQLYDSGQAENNDNEAVLAGVISNRLNTLKNSILELKLHVEERKALHARIVQSLDALVLEARNRVISIKDRGIVSKNPEMVRRRTMLEENINFLENQKLVEQLQFWRDNLDLQKELKEVLEDERALSLANLLESGSQDG